MYSLKSKEQNIYFLESMPGRFEAKTEVNVSSYDKERGPALCFRLEQLSVNLKSVVRRMGKWLA